MRKTKHSPKKGLFAAVPVPGPPCLNRDERFTKSSGNYWVCPRVCPKCGRREKKDTGI